MNGRFSVKGLSKGRPACPSIFFSDFSGKDRALLVQQIGGANAGRGMNFSSKFVLGVVNRCLYGNARVLLCRCMKDGVPFPTSFWLVCPHLVKVAGRLEAENGVASMEAASAGDAAVWLSFHTMHARLRMCLLHAARRKFMRAYRGNMYRSLCLGGVGGITYAKGKVHVKCLHLQIASFLAMGWHPAEKWLREKIPNWQCRSVLCDPGENKRSRRSACDFGLQKRGHGLPQVGETEEKTPSRGFGKARLKFVQDSVSHDSTRCGGRVLLVKY